MAEYAPYRLSQHPEGQYEGQYEEQYDGQYDGRYGAPRQPSSNYDSRSHTHNSHFSHATSTQSWVQNTSQNPPPPPIDAYDVEHYSGPIRTPRPLPQPQLHRHTLYTVNASDPDADDDEEEYMNIDPNVSGQYDFQNAYTTATPNRRVFASPEPLQPPPELIGPGSPPTKQRSFVGGFVRGLRRLPKRMMGYGVSSEKGRLFRRGTFGTEASSTTAGMGAGNTLPLYRSNPGSPVAGPSNVEYVQDVQTAFASHHPVPDVIRAPEHSEEPYQQLQQHLQHPPQQQQQHHLDPIPPALLSGAALRRVTPTFRVTPPSDSVSHESHAQIHQSPQPQYVQVVHPDPVAATAAERTTVMVYTESADHHSAEQGGPALTRVPSRTPRTSAATPARASSITIQTPLSHARPTALPPPAATSPELDPDPEEVAERRRQQQEQDLMSPATEHPLPSADYRKMPHFPGSPSRNTMTVTGTSWYGTSYASELTPMERFFKTLYNLPWVSHGRVTIDYRPAAGLEGKLKTKGLTKKPMASWYRRLSRSLRNQAELDLLSSSTGPEATPRESFGTSLMSSIPSVPRSSGTKQSGGTTSSSAARHRHHRSGHHHRKRQRHRRRSMSTIEEPVRGESPMLPAVYPYAYPAYPFTYPGYGAVPPGMAPMPSPPTSPNAVAASQMQMAQLAAMQQQMQMVSMPVPQTSGRHQSRGGGGRGREERERSGSTAKRAPRGPRSRHTSRKPTYPGGYAPYQPMAFPPPPMYVTQQQQASPTGSGGAGGEASGSTPPSQGHMVYVPMQVVPGGYNPGMAAHVVNPSPPGGFPMHDSTMSSIPSPPSSPTPRAGSTAPPQAAS